MGDGVGFIIVPPPKGLPGFIMLPPPTVFPGLVILAPPIVSPGIVFPTLPATSCATAAALSKARKLPNRTILVFIFVSCAPSVTVVTAAFLAPRKIIEEGASRVITATLGF